MQQMRPNSFEYGAEGRSGRVWVCESEKGGGGGGGGVWVGVVIADNDNQVRGQDNTPAQYSQHFMMRWC